MVHEGHRQRMLQKFKNGEVSLDHELLEILLFNAYPRRNTNPVAHALLDTFGTLRGVFEADIEEMTKIAGVGEDVAAYIKCVGACAKPAYSVEPVDVFLTNYGEFKEFAARRLRVKTYEVLELYMLEKSGRVKYVYSHTTQNKHGVSVDRADLLAAIAPVRPYGIIAAHNHVTGDSRPSGNDDIFTKEMSAICEMCGVRFLDHCIYAADNDVYSYFGSDRLD